MALKNRIETLHQKHEAAISQQYELFQDNSIEDQHRNKTVRELDEKRYDYCDRKHRIMQEARQAFSMTADETIENVLSQLEQGIRWHKKYNIIPGGKNSVILTMTDGQILSLTFPVDLETAKLTGNRSDIGTFAVNAKQFLTDEL